VLQKKLHTLHWIRLRLLVANENVPDTDQETVQLVIDGVLDLHAFSPKDLKYLIPDYIDECIKLKIFEIRIIHGKGIGNIRRSVHALLDRNPNVIQYKLGGLNKGSWGATIVQLKTCPNFS
jgi:dsDNA-specific endonuclease/ATPase MutS2